MFDSIKKLFGDGVVHFTFETADGKSGKGKIPYIGEYDEKELIAAVKKTMRVEHNTIATKITIVAHYEK
jgi:hypothetical protein